MDMCTVVSYIPCATYPKEQTGDIITFTQFEEGFFNLKLVKMQRAMKKNDQSDDNSIIPSLLSL